MLGSVPAQSQYMVYASLLQRFAVLFKILPGKTNAGDMGDGVNGELLLYERSDLDGFSCPGTACAVGAAYKIGMQFRRLPQKVKNVVEFLFLFRRKYLEGETCSVCHNMDSFLFFLFVT